MASDFDNAAIHYDTVFSFSEIGKAQRQRVYHFLDKFVLQGKKALHILELNCGTGEDAFYLTQLGHQLTATDISTGMIERATAKYGHHITFKTQDINTLKATTFEQKFDLVFSNFGGLNCLSPDQLQTFLKLAPALLKPSGIISLVLMPKKCIWERVYFLAKAQFKNAFRRNTKQGIPVQVEGTAVTTWYYNPQQINHFSKHYFKPLGIAPIGIAIPPSYLEPFFKTKKVVFKLLKKVETYLTSSFWAAYADHYIIVLQKK